MVAAVLSCAVAGHVKSPCGKMLHQSLGSKYSGKRSHFLDASSISAGLRPLFWGTFLSTLSCVFYENLRLWYGSSPVWWTHWNSPGATKFTNFICRPALVFQRVCHDSDFCPHLGQIFFCPALHWPTDFLCDFPRGSISISKSDIQKRLKFPGLLQGSMRSHADLSFEWPVACTHYYLKWNAYTET